MRQNARTELVRLTVEAPPMPPWVFDEIAGELRELGFEASHTTGVEERSRVLAWEIALRVWDQIDEPTIAVLFAAFVGWIKRVRQQRASAGSVTLKLYGPDGKVIRETPVD